MALAGAVDAVGPVQAGVEPLRRVRRGDLRGEHVAQFVEEGGGVLVRVEISALPAPIGPRAGEPVEDLASPKSPRCSAPPWRDRRAPPRRQPSARGKRGRCSPRRASAAPARRPCGSIFARARRPRPGSRPPALRCLRARRRWSRRDCGFRFWSCGIRAPHTGSDRLWCSGVRSAFLSPPLIFQTGRGSASLRRLRNRFVG